jgi:hypothetical protein
MHASIWRFRADPDDLLRRYDAVVAEIPAASMRLHLCLRADDGIMSSTRALTARRMRHSWPGR